MAEEIHRQHPDWLVGWGEATCRFWGCLSALAGTPDSCWVYGFTPAELLARMQALETMVRARR